MLKMDFVSRGGAATRRDKKKSAFSVSTMSVLKSFGKRSEVYVCACQDHLIEPELETTIIPNNG
jgi:hypothetical protein